MNEFQTNKIEQLYAELERKDKLISALENKLIKFSKESYDKGFDDGYKEGSTLGTELLVEQED